MKLATLCYVLHEDKVLMLFRNKKENDIHEGKWNGLGGKFEESETPEDCVKREILEESGLKIERPKLQGFLTFPKFSKGEDWYVFVFTASQFEGELIDSPEGELKWIKREELLSLELWDGDREFLPYLFKPGVFSGRFEYVDGELRDSEMTVYLDESSV